MILINSNLNYKNFTSNLMLVVMTLFVNIGFSQFQTTTDFKKMSQSDSIILNKQNDPRFFIEGQLCQHLRKIFQDSKGNLWFGTNNYEVMRYDGNSLKYFTESDGLNNGRITGIVEDSLGNIWFGTYLGLTKFDGLTFTTLTKEDGLLNNEIWNLIIDKNGLFWIGTNEGLCTFDGSNFEIITFQKATINSPKTIYSNTRISGLVEDHDGNIWFGTDGFGVYKYNGLTFKSFTTENGLCDNVIGDLFIDNNGYLWIGTFWGGVSKYDGETFHNYTYQGEVEGTEVGAFFGDSNGDVWFAVENFGVYKHNGESFTNYNETNGLNTNAILSIYKDKDDRFWFGGWGGLFRFDGVNFVSISENGPWKN
jgi:ligand-binding sensor domain-containing protein